jgi:hypothetical protein
VWDLSLEDDTLLGSSTATSALSHTEPIAAVTWVFNLREQAHEVLSVAADGKVQPAAYEYSSAC